MNEMGFLFVVFRVPSIATPPLSSLPCVCVRAQSGTRSSVNRFTGCGTFETICHRIRLKCNKPKWKENVPFAWKFVQSILIGGKSALFSGIYFVLKFIRCRKASENEQQLISLRHLNFFSIWFRAHFSPFGVLFDGKLFLATSLAIDHLHV